MNKSKHENDDGPGAWLIAALREAGLTQAELSRRVALREQRQAADCEVDVSRWVNEHRPFTVRALHAIAHTLAEADYGTFESNAAALLERTVKRFGAAEAV